MPTSNSQNFDGLSYTAIPRIITALPYEVLHILDSFPEAVLAGGAIASILTGQPAKDYDIFISGTARLPNLKQRLNDYLGSQSKGGWITSPRAETWVPNPGESYTLQADRKLPAAGAAHRAV